MRTKTADRLSAGLAVAFWLVIAGQAQARPASSRYRIDLAGGASVIALDVPVRRGTVYTFHDGENGVLTGLPAEQVVEIEVLPMVDTPAVAHRQPSIESPEFVRPLEPGEMLVIGSTGDGALPAPDTTGAVAAGGQAQAVVPGANPYGYGGYVAPTPRIVGPNGVPTALSSTDISQALASTTAPNGFPATTSSPTTIGPNGTPTLSPGMPGSDLTIGPNGYPQTFTPPVIGPDGLPVLAPSGTPIAAQPVIGSNGTPVSAPAGAPGAAQAQIGPNGTPILAPAGGPGTAAPSIGPNGFPTAPAQAPAAIQAPAATVAPKAAAAPAGHGSGH